MPNTIMFVDDEQQILRALNRLFEETGYHTVLMASGEEALAFMEHTPVNLVVADIRMPGINGFDLLRQVKDKYPAIMRVALSGYTDSRAIYKALEENVAKMYMFKPWDNRELQNTIDKMFQLEEIFTDKKIMDLINNLDDIPTIPTLYNKIRTMIQEDEDVEKIAALIEADQSSSAKILRIANSAFYGAKTGSISQAIMYIGLANVKSILLSNAVFNVKGPMKDRIRELWHHAALTNKMTNHLYWKITGKKIPNVFASAGLLHNVGMVVLMSHYPDLCKDVLVTGFEGFDASPDLSKEVLGVTHEELGGYLLNWWELPLPIVESALYHRNPISDRVINREIVCVVHLASCNAWKRMGEAAALSPDYNACCEMIGTTAEAVDGYLEEITGIEAILD